MVIGDSEKNQRGNIVLVLLVVALGIVLFGGYVYSQRGNEQNDETPTVTPVPIVLNSFPTPLNVEEWVDSVVTEDTVWSFKYPGDWQAVKYPGQYVYRPENVEDNEFGLGFVRVLDEAETLEGSVQKTLGVEQLIEQKEIIVGGKDAVWLKTVSDNRVGIRVFVSNVSYSKSGLVTEEDSCWEGMLAIYASQVNENGENEFMYEDEIKSILSTFLFDDECVENN